jgi:hypothetical protein
MAKTATLRVAGDVGVTHGTCMRHDRRAYIQKIKRVAGPRVIVSQTESCEVERPPICEGQQKPKQMGGSAERSGFRAE